MNESFWKNKTVFITGNTGFKGSWITLLLQSLGSKIIGYSLKPPTNPSLFELALAYKDITMIQGDIRDKNLLKKTLDKYRPQIIIHMAAQALVRDSYIYPVETYETNVMGTVYLLDAIRKIPGVQLAIFITSDKCYENLELTRPYNEGDRMGGFDPYSSSKGCDELIISAYRRSFFNDHKVALASVRAGNVVGGGDWAKDRLVVDAMMAFMNKQNLRIRSPDSVRPWQHVLDPLSGYLMLAENLWHNGHLYAKAWNFGPNSEDSRTVSWVADMLCQYWANGAEWMPDNNKKNPHEAGLLFLDSSKARIELGWQPKLNIIKSLSWTVDWYKAYHKDKNMRSFTLRQIEEYQSLHIN